MTCIADVPGVVPVFLPLTYPYRIIPGNNFSARPVQSILFPSSGFSGLADGIPDHGK
jgi:hypothetical protein